ncbi:hypothetical protein VTH06DRAFT_8260 [Thermothelomyces fergusii]
MDRKRVRVGTGSGSENAEDALTVWDPSDLKSRYQNRRWASASPAGTRETAEREVKVNGRKLPAPAESNAER